MVSLINSGYDYDEILSLFISQKCAGKFRELYEEKPESALNYFDNTYKNAKSWALSNVSHGRLTAKKAEIWASNKAWPGRTGNSDKLVYLAHAKIAYRCGKRIYGASCREIAEISNLARNTASIATRRLINQGLVKLEKKGTGYIPSQYSLRIIDTFPQTEGVTMRECNLFPQHDVFGRGGLSQSAKQILDQLINGPQTQDELVKSTGRNIKTIKYWLKFMHRIIDPSTGEILSLVIRKGEKWYLQESYDLDRMANIFGVSGRMKNRKEKHNKERDLFRRSLKFPDSSNKD
jgi:hypothetical protein